MTDIHNIQDKQLWLILYVDNLGTRSYARDDRSKHSTLYMIIQRIYMNISKELYFKA